MGPLIKFLACFAIISLVACTTTPKGTFCQISDPIRLSPAAVAALSDAEVETILAHNRKLQRLCGIQP